jgi:methylated-DNA-[protein]-cysteine S-methyltransferase
MPAATYKRNFASPVGQLEITATINAVTAISFIESDISDDNATIDLLIECQGQLEQYFSGNRTTFDLPLAPKGTDFEQSIWKELLNVEYGSTKSYLDIAKKMNNPGAIRAVGRANGANPIAIIIPCHRIVGSDGSLTGYAGGLWRKRWLLDHEAKVAGTQLF